MGNALAEIVRHAAVAYGDTSRVVRTMWRPLAVILATLVASGAVNVVLQTLVSTPVGRVLLDTICSAGALWVMAPYLVAIYRAIAGEPVANVAALRNTAASQHLFAWSAVLAFVSMLPGLAYALLADRRSYPIYYSMENPPPAAFNASLIVAGLLIGVVIFSVRASTLLPGVALYDRPRTFAEAFAETRGRFWFTFGALTLPLVPVIVGLGILQAMQKALPAASLLQWVLIALTIAASVAMLLLSVAVTVRLHQRYSMPEAAE